MSFKPKLVFIISGFTVGGAQKQLAQYILARPAALRKLELEVITFLPTLSRSIEASFTEMGIPITVIDRETTPFPVFFWKLFRAIRRARPTAVHTVLAGSTGTWGRLAAWLAGVPYIFHSDRNLAPPVTMTQRLLRPFLDRLTHHFLPNADAISSWLVGLGVPQSKITVVPNVVDLGKFDPTATPSPRARWGIPNESVVAGFLANFGPEKRLDLLLDAFESLAEADRPDFLVLGGDGRLMPMVRERVHNHPWLRERCRLLGMVEDPAGFMAGIDYLVLSSDREGRPNVVLEAMAMSKPVVATSVSDLPSLLEGVGLLAVPGDVGSLAGAIRSMQQLTREERDALGQRGRVRVQENYELQRAAERFWNVQLAALSTEGVRHYGFRRV